MSELSSPDDQLSQDRSILGPDDPEPFEIYNAGGNAHALVIADHASNHVPASLDNLGLDQEDLNKHYAMDIGTGALSRRLADRLDSRCYLAAYSRLVVDLNRHEDHSTLITEEGEGKPIPGNQGLSHGDRTRRMQAIYHPYHQKLDNLITGYLANDIVPVLISIHSFTPLFFNARRPWEIGVLWAQDDKIARHVYDDFNARGYCVGDNQPYDMRMLSGSTVSRHGDERRLPNVLIEVRNDLLETEEMIERWAEMLAECLEPVIKDPSMHTLYEGPLFVHDFERENAYFQELIEKAKKGQV